MATGGDGKVNPFDEGDIGKRFQMLKEQMNEERQAEDGLGDGLMEPAGPASGGSPNLKIKTKDFRPYKMTMTGQKKVTMPRDRLTPTKGGKATQI